MELWLVDIKPELVRAWREAFTGLPNVFVEQGDILALAEDTIVSPANSHGLMDGGIDLHYLNRFGMVMQNRVLAAIAALPEQLLPVGAAIVVATGDPRIPRLVCAPTMVTPEPVPPSHAFFATSAALQAVNRERKPVRKLFCPGLATGIGAVAPEDAAKEMAAAYRKWLDQRHTR